jgi:hypothetical protein
MERDWISRFPSGFFAKTNWLLIVILCDSCSEARLSYIDFDRRRRMLPSCRPGAAELD